MKKLSIDIIDERFIKAQELIKAGGTIRKVLKEIGISDSSYYNRLNKSKRSYVKSGAHRKIKVIDIPQVSVPPSHSKLMVLIGSPTDIIEAMRGIS